MKEQKHIRNRITQRHGNRYSSYHQSSPSALSRLYRLMISIMIVVLLALGTLTFMRTPMYQEVKNVTISLVPQLTKMVTSSFLARWIPFERWLPLKEEVPVVANSVYMAGSQNGYYTSEGNQAISLFDGLVVYIGEENGSRWIVVHHDNALYTTYGNLDQVNVKIYDRIMKSDILGTYLDEIQLAFLYQNNDISYEEAISLQED